MSAVVLLLLAGCDEPRPKSAAQAVAIADALLEKEGRDWGPSWQVVEPDGPEPDGRWWIQVTYAPDQASGAQRLILVNRVSGWARHPGPEWRTRYLVSTSGTPAHPSSAVVVPGDRMLVVADATGRLDELATSLNRAILRAGLAPLFSVRDDAHLVYGRMGDQGLTPDQRVEDWLSSKGGWKDLRWEPIQP